MIHVTGTAQQLLQGSCDPALTARAFLAHADHIIVNKWAVASFASTAAELMLPFLMVCWEAEGPPCVGGAPLQAEYIYAHLWTQQGRSPEDFSLGRGPVLAAVTIAQLTEGDTVQWPVSLSFPAFPPQLTSPCVQLSRDLSLEGSRIELPVFQGISLWRWFCLDRAAPYAQNV